LVSVPLDGVDAKLRNPIDAPIEQSATAITMRMLKIPDCELDFFCIVGILLFYSAEEALSESLLNRRILSGGRIVAKDNLKISNNLGMDLHEYRFMPYRGGAAIGVTKIEGVRSVG
jgi:hypothetical protein